MFPLNLGFPTDEPKTVVCIGAHCDDIEIGCGATLRQMALRYPLLRFYWCILTTEADRASESRAAAAALLGADRVTVEVHGLRPSYLPAQWTESKDIIEALRARFDPAVVFTHRLEDRHQDHRQIAELTWNSFRNHLILEYEIAKYEGDLGQPNVYVALTAEEADFKAKVLLAAFTSQLSRAWFDADTFLGLMRLRGIECQAPGRYAEAFTARKMLLR